MEKLDKRLLLFLFSVFIVYWRLGALIILVLLVLLGLYDVIKKKTFKVSYLIFAPFFLFYVFSSFFKGNFVRDLPYFSEILFFSVGIFSLVPFSGKDIMLATKVFVFAVLTADIYSILHLSYYFHQMDYEFSTANFGHLNEALAFERPYIGFKNAVVFLIGLFSADMFKNKVLRIASVIIPVFYVLFISARLAVLLILISIGVYIFTMIKSKLVKVLSVVVSVITIFILLLSVTSLMERFMLLSKDHRVLLWANSWKITGEDDFSYLVGSKQLGQKAIRDYTTDKIVSEISDKNMKEYYQRKNFNTHNQFLNIFLFSGIIGLILLIVPMMIHLKNPSQLNIMSTLIMVNIIGFLFVENVFERELGTLTISFLYYSALRFPQKREVSVVRI